MYFEKDLLKKCYKARNFIQGKLIVFLLVCAPARTYR